MLYGKERSLKATLIPVGDTSLILKLKDNGIKRQLNTRTTARRYWIWITRNRLINMPTNLKTIEFAKAMELSAANHEVPCQHCLTELLTAAKDGYNFLFRLDGDEDFHVYATEQRALKAIVI
jgi:hypothetical protein